MAISSTVRLYFIQRRNFKCKFRLWKYEDLDRYNSWFWQRLRLGEILYIERQQLNFIEFKKIWTKNIRKDKIDEIFFIKSKKGLSFVKSFPKNPNTKKTEWRFFKWYLTKRLAKTIQWSQSCEIVSIFLLNCSN